MIVVLDSGIWLSAVRFGGTPLKAVERALFADQIAISDVIRQEVLRIAETKFCLNRAEVAAGLAEYLSTAIIIEIQYDVNGICRDPNDDHVLECVQKACAERLVTGDKDLLVLRRFGVCEIVTAQQYVSGM